MMMGADSGMNECLYLQELTKTYSECGTWDVSPKTSDIDPELIDDA